MELQQHDQETSGAHKSDEAELKRRIEIADRVLWETRHGTSANWCRDYSWLQAERARLVRELEARQNQR